MKVLFLDVDGVLNSIRQLKQLKGKPKPLIPEALRPIYGGREKVEATSYYFDPEAVAALNHLVKESRCRVVISSTWRDWKLNELYQHFKWQGYTGPAFYSRTPCSALGGGPHVRRWHRAHGYEVAPQSGLIFVGGRRGAEIDWWLQNVGQGRVKSFVILDDETDMEPHLSRLVLTSYETGLTMEQAQRVVEMLNEKGD